MGTGKGEATYFISVMGVMGTENQTKTVHRWTALLNNELLGTLSVACLRHAHPLQHCHDAAPF
jgi:hypothetical protein